MLNDSSVIISDTTPLITLAGVQQLQLLPLLFGSIVIPSIVVYDEYHNGKRENEADLNFPWLVMQQVSESDIAEYSDMYRLDAGEAACLFLACQHASALLILDEQHARQVAKDLGIPTTGTLGLLRIAKQRNIIPALRPVIEAMRAQGRRLSVHLCNTILLEVGEAALDKA